MFLVNSKGVKKAAESAAREWGLGADIDRFKPY
jgi:hypothetical protein